MKTSLIVILLSMPIFCLGQQEVCVYKNFEVLGKDTINVRLNDLKEGAWVYYVIAYESKACFTTAQCYHKKAIRFIKSKGEYVKGEKVGTWTEFYETGEIKRKLSYADGGRRNGVSMEFFKNGTVKSKQAWKEGEIESQIGFFENGNKRFEAKFENQSLAFFKIFYPSGKIKYLGETVAGWKIENLSYYRENGVKHKTRSKKYGALLAEEGLISYL